MYHHIKGMVHSLKPSTAVIENGGIGYLLKISLNTYASLKQGFESTVFTHLVVREDSQTLFGFSDIEERDMFLTLLGVGGVGPGNAINVLSYMKPSAIERAASSEDKAAFRAVKGVGEKLSAQLVLDLKGKFKQTISRNRNKLHRLQIFKMPFRLLFLLDLQSRLQKPPLMNLLLEVRLGCKTLFLLH